jgi:chromate reductase
MANEFTVRVLGISGSLRKASFNADALRAARELAPAGMEIEVYQGLGTLPLYDEDLRAQGFPPAVQDLRDRIKAADALLFVTPEYNYSVPGVLKNAIDWASRPKGAAALLNKTVSVVGASQGQFGAMWAQQDLRRILGIAGARVIGEGLPVSRVHEGLDEATFDGLRTVLDELVEAVEAVSVAA